MGDRNVGNRFDSPTGAYGVGYFGSDTEACYAETMARFRPDPSLEQFFDHDDSMGFGALPRDWRERRRLINARFAQAPERPHLDFVDIEHAQTLRHLERALIAPISAWGYEKLNASVIRSSDRRVTRLISDYVHEQKDDRGRPRYAGIRYLSQLGSNWECWAVFEGVKIERISTSAIDLGDETFKKIADLYNLQPF